MNLKEAFRYQNKLQALLDEAQGILDCDSNVTNVANTYLRHKVMAEAEDETILDLPQTEYAQQITDIARFMLYLLEEKGRLFAAIRKAKDALDMDMDMRPEPVLIPSASRSDGLQPPWSTRRNEVPYRFPHS